MNDQTEKSAWQPITGSEVDQLRVASEKRVKANKKFDEVKKELVELNENKGVVNLAEFRTKSQERKKKEDKDDKKSTKQKVKERDEPQVNEAMNILADLLAIRKGWNREQIAVVQQN